MRCRLILLISEHPIQQGIRKGGGLPFCDEDRRTDEDRMTYSRQTFISFNKICLLIDICQPSCFPLIFESEHQKESLWLSVFEFVRS